MIRLRNIDLSFNGKTVFSNLSADLPAEGTTVFRGASGAGKTTLFRLLLGLQKPDGGTITGMEFQKPAVVFQEDRLLSWANALENASLGSDRQTAERALTALGLQENLLQLPRELSGGMRRRVAIARALSYGGDALFLDEPFTGLDEENKIIVAREVRRLGVPVYVITHENDEAALFGEYATVTVGLSSEEEID
jgi:NitT/TauT family transport system ATP-binding protein